MQDIYTKIQKIKDIELKKYDFKNKLFKYSRKNRYYNRMPYINLQENVFSCLGIILEFCDYAEIDFKDFVNIVNKTECCEDFTGENLNKYYENWKMKDTALNMYFQMFNYKQYFEYVKDHFSMNAINYCDFGCGSGLNSLKLYKDMKFKNMDLYDVENYSAKFIKNYIKKHEFKNLHWENVLDEKSFEKKENFYDVIVCSDVFEHLTNPTEILKKIYALLKTGGTLILSAPFEENSLTEHIIEAPIDFYNNGGYDFLKKKFVKRHHFSWYANINAVYEKRGA